MNNIVGNESSLTVGGLSQPGDEEICINFILAGDLGGTNTRLALYKLVGGGRRGDTNTNEETEIILNWSQSWINTHLFIWDVIRPFLERYFLDTSSPSLWQQ